MICDFESISIPGPKSQKQHHCTDFIWVPFPLSKPDLLNQENRLSERWAPTNWTEKFLIAEHEEVKPWTIDLYAVGGMWLCMLANEGWETLERWAPITEKFLIAEHEKVT